jgi:hypothetical protein
MCVELRVHVEERRCLVRLLPLGDRLHGIEVPQQRAISKAAGLAKVLLELVGGVVGLTARAANWRSRVTSSCTFASAGRAMPSHSVAR